MAAELRLDFVCPKTKDDFIASPEGLFCTECEKPVVDFTGKKQPEIVRELRKYDKMPCVWIPTDTLKQPLQVTKHWWSPWRKLLMWVSLFVLLADTKALFAQTGIETKAGDNKKATPLGYQKITFTGTIKDTKGNPLRGAELRFMFLSQTLGQGKTGDDGSYRIELENYGGIREVDIEVSAPGHFGRSFTDISVAKANPTFITELTPHPTGAGEPWQVRTAIAGGIGFYEITRVVTYIHDPGAPTSIDIFGHPLVHFNTQEPEYLDQKLSYQAQVTDMKGNAIPGARVEMRFTDNQAREGFANNDGRLLMNIQLDSASTHAHIVVSAPGYYSKTIPFYEFDKEEPIVHKLIKKPVEKPEVPAEDVPESALPAGTEKPTTENETLVQSAGILVYPNPANETVTVNLPGNYNATLQVADQNGRIILRKSSYRQTSVSLDTQNFAPGAYTVQVTCNGAIYHEKLLIVR